MAKIKPIKPELREILEAFLSEEDFFPIFQLEAKKLGYTGDDKDKIRVALFTPNKDSEVCFANQEIYELFIDFQILTQLSKDPLYNQIIEEHPEVIPNLLEVGREMLEIMYE